jgi:hypothetical protein
MAGKAQSKAVIRYPGLMKEPRGAVDGAPNKRRHWSITNPA